MDCHSQLIVSTDNKKLDVEFVVSGLKKMYWSGQRSREDMIKSFNRSLCFSLLDGDQQVGFARVVTDFSTFAYLCDVFVTEEKRGKGYGKKLMKEILEYEELQKVKWILRTRDAHGLYEQFGFTRTERPDRYMEKN